MKGDILIINDNHRQAARQCVEYILPGIKDSKQKLVITVAGESGAGKSEISASIASELNGLLIKTTVIQQDDYFVYPPRTNAAKRIGDIKWVGPQEVRTDLLETHIKSFSTGAVSIIKPLVIFGEDRIDSEEIKLTEYRVLIIDGTYTTLLKGADIKIFIDRDLTATRAARQLRNREKQDIFLEQVLEIEHKIISKHKLLADIIITNEFEVIKNLNW
jgi:uridine kinase